MSNYQTCACGLTHSNTTRNVACENCLANLAANLAVAGALCKAFRLGSEDGWNSASVSEGFADIDPWHPGCGLPALGKEAE